VAFLLAAGRAEAMLTLVIGKIINLSRAILAPVSSELRGKR
jgi:hypothetical protein